TCRGVGFWARRRSKHPGPCGRAPPRAPAPARSPGSYSSGTSAACEHTLRTCRVQRQQRSQPGWSAPAYAGAVSARVKPGSQSFDVGNDPSHATTLLQQPRSAQRLYSPMIAALASELKLSWKPITAAEVSAVACRLSAPTANTVNR